MTTVTLSRLVAADPASVALLLAEPVHIDDRSGRLTLLTPRRAGVGFVAGLAIVDRLGRPLAGEVLVEPATDAGCMVRLVSAVPDRVAARLVERIGAEFIDALADRARSRSYAA